MPATVAVQEYPLDSLEPTLYHLARQDPNDRVRVIVQLQRPDRAVETMVQRAGGQIVNRLDLINAFVADVQAQTLLSLAQAASVDWISLDAPVRKQNSSSDNQVLISDEFNQVSYAGSNGEAGWSSDWQEIGETDGAEQGNIAITSFWGGALQGLRLQDSNMGIARMVDLASAQSASLSVAYRRKDLMSAEQAVTIAISADNGSSWQEIGRLSGPATDTEIQYAYFDLTAFAGSSIILQLLNTPAMDENSKLYLDAITVSFTPTISDAAPAAKVYLPLVSNADSAVVADESAAEAFVQAAVYSTANLASPYIKVIGADRVWTEGPAYLTGSNVTVAVVDSGITDHPDLRTANNQSRVIARVNFASGQSLPDDFYGHGTHVAGIVGGNGLQSNGKYMGVAPDARVVDVKVTDDKGAGSTSDVVAGLQWVLNNKNTYGIRVVNLSLNSTVPDSYHSNPLNAAVEILWFNGIVVVVSAGNGGSYKLYPPANDPFVITVGSADDKGTVSSSDDELSKFSAFNITEDGFVKPDIIAPGRDIVGLLSSDDNNLASTHPENKLSGNETAYYYKMSGTSMASAVVAGAVALLLQKEPTLTPDQVKHRLMSTTKPFITTESCATGAGYLDIYAATHTNTTTSANTGIAASQLLWSGSNPITWNSVSWNSVSWNSVSWNSVSWNSVSWNSVSWNSVSWNSVNTNGNLLQGNCSDINTTGLLGHWRLNESGGGIASDASGNDNKGTLLNGVNRTVAGRMNNAGSFDGANDVITAPSSSSLNNVGNQLTVAAWAYREADQSGWRVILQRQLGDSTQEAYALAFSSNAYRFALATANNGQLVLSGSLAPTQQWVHLAGVYNGSVMLFYVNGQPVVSRVASGAVSATTKPFLIGAGQNDATTNFQEAFQGRIDDVRVYNRALSASEIAALVTGPQIASTQNAIAPHVIYSDGLASNWVDWSWSTTRNFNNTSPAFSGSKSIALAYTSAWGGLFIHNNNPVSTAGYKYLRFRIHGGASGTRTINVLVNENTNYYYPVTVSANQWTQVDIPLTSVGNPSTLSEIDWQDGLGKTQATFYIDQVELVP